MDLESLYCKIARGCYSGAVIDSREAGKNQVFFALRGARVDGSQFLAEIAARGAAAAVVSAEYSGEEHGLELVRVENVLAALHALAARHYRDFSVRSVGVTGSVGKTTIKEFLATILEGKYSVAKTPGSANAQATFPLAVLNRSGKEEVFVMEMGMSEAGELSRLVAIAPPDLALVGKIALAHAQFFQDGLEGIARAKAEILSQARTEAAILHASTDRFAPFQQAKLGEKILYGGGDYCLEEKAGMLCINERGERSPLFRLPFEETHLRENFLAAAAAARWLGMQWEEIFARSVHLKMLPKRFEKFEREGIHYINDSYNSNPASLAAALENLPKPISGKKIAVIGEMRELGSYSASAHRELGIKALECVDLLIAYGQETLPMVEVFSAAGRAVSHFVDLNEAKEALRKAAQPGDLVLLKASKSNSLWTILE